MITGTTRIAAVIGWPVEHSRSPQMINAAFAAASIDAVMIPIGAPPERFAEVIAGLRAMNATSRHDAEHPGPRAGVLGAAVTVPHKLAALAACDQVSPDARDIGAVNCLHFDEGRLVGHNTDAPGFADGLAAAGFSVGGAHVAVLGAGGAARAIAYGLAGSVERPAHATSIDVIARRPDPHAWRSSPVRVLAWTETQLRASFARADLVIDCTAAGLSTDDERALVDALPLDALRPSAWVSTLIYHRSTLLLERAKARGHSTVDGRAMLVHQGARAFAIWTKTPPPIDVMTRALDDALRGT